MLDEQQAVNALTRITRLAQREPDKRDLLRRALEQDLVGLAPLALQVGVETGEPMPSTLAETLAASPVGAQAAALVERDLPQYTVAMLGLAKQVSAARVRGLDPDDPELGPALVDHAERLADAGDHQAAAEAAARGVDALRGRDDPDALAHALMVSARALHGAGAREASLTPAREAVAIRRRLAGGEPDQRLAGALLNLANRLGSEDEALACYTEAAAQFRALIATAPRRLDYQLEDARESGAETIWIDLSPGPGGAAPPAGAAAVAVDLRAGVEPSGLRHGLALALLNMVDRLVVAGRRDEAARAADEAVELLRDLADDKPDVYAMQLAAGLLWQAGAYVDTDAERALAPAREAAERLRAIESEHPGAAWGQLGMALVTLSIALVRLGRLEEALAVTRELDALGWADDTPLLAQLVDQFEDLSAGLAQAHNPSAAVAASRAAVAAARRLDDDRLGPALHNLSRRLNAAGDDTEASAASAEAVERLGPVFLRGELDGRTMGAIVWQYCAAASRAGLPLDPRLGLAALVARLTRTAEPEAVAPIARLAVDTVEACRDARDLDGARTALDGLLALARAHPGERAAGVGYALAAYNVVHDVVELGRLADAEPIVDALVGLSVAGDPIVMREAGKAAFVVVASYLQRDADDAAARVARAAGAALRSEPYLRVRREEFGEPSPDDYLAALDALTRG